MRANTAIDAEALARIRAAGIRNLHTLHFNELNRGPYISNTLVLDEKLDEDLARNAIYRMLRPGDPPNAGSRQQPISTAYSSTKSTTTCRRSGG